MRSSKSLPGGAPAKPKPAPYPNMITNSSPDKEIIMSVRYYIHVGMNRPTVNMPEAVQGILQHYDVRPALQVVPANETGTGVLDFLEDEDMLVEWPSAVQAAQLPAGADDEERPDELHKELGQQ